MTCNSAGRERRQLIIFAVFCMKLTTWPLYLYWHHLTRHKSISTWAQAISISSAIERRGKWAGTAPGSMSFSLPKLATESGDDFSLSDSVDIHLTPGSPLCLYRSQFRYTYRMQVALICPALCSIFPCRSSAWRGCCIIQSGFGAGIARWLAFAVETLIAARAFQAIKYKGRANVFMGSVIALAYFVAIIVLYQWVWRTYNSTIRMRIRNGSGRRSSIRPLCTKDNKTRSRKEEVEDWEFEIAFVGTRQVEQDLRLEKRAYKAWPCYPIRTWVQGRPWSWATQGPFFHIGKGNLA